MFKNLFVKPTPAPTAFQHFSKTFADNIPVGAGQVIGSALAGVAIAMIGVGAEYIRSYIKVKGQPANVVEPPQA